MSEEPITGNQQEVVPAEEIAEVPAEGAPQGQGSEEQAPRAAGGYRGGTRQREAEGLAAAPRERQRRFKRRRKICAFCIEKARVIDHKEVPKLRRFITERGKIMPRRQTGTCARHQRMLATAIRRARECALLPYVAQ